MSFEVTVVSVFVVDDPFAGGNPLAVVLGAEDLPKRRMQALARTLNFSESTFVDHFDRGSYGVRIFTPEEEIAFAGHPTCGTAFVMWDRGLIHDEEVEQRSPAGVTQVTRRGDLIWFQRTGSSESDADQRDPAITSKVARALGLEDSDIGLEARELGRSGHLRPAFADAGLRQFMVPVRDLDALRRASPNDDLLRELTSNGAYVYTSGGPGSVRARGFWGPIGVTEDPATGSAAAALGLHLAARIGDIRFEISQGIEIGHPSLLRVEAADGKASVGGKVAKIIEGKLLDL